MGMLPRLAGAGAMPGQPPAPGPEAGTPEQAQAGIGLATGLMLTAVALFSDAETPVGWAQPSVPASPKGGGYGPPR